MNKWDNQQIAGGTSFFQSSYWGEFQKSLGHQPHFLSGEGWSCLLIERTTRLGKYLFAPYGPTLDNAEDLQAALNHIKTLAKERGVNWVRLEPLSHNGSLDELKILIKKSGGRPAPHDVEPATTRIIDLTPSPEKLLQSVSQSTRSLIRQNQRLGDISFTTSVNTSDISIFVQMLDIVAKRNHVGFFSEEYFTKQAQILMPAGAMHLELAHYQGKALAAAVIHNYGPLATYTYAGSLPEAREKSASALLLWQALLNAKNRGAQKFDLFGIAPEGASKSHPWHGFSAFKQKFGGEAVQHAGTWDIPLGSKYKLYRAAYRVKKLV